MAETQPASSASPARPPRDKLGAALSESKGPPPAAPKKAPKVRARTVVFVERCKGCELCVTFCPMHVLEMSPQFNPKGYHYPVVARPDECIGCGLCGMFCPDFAVFGERLDLPAKKAGAAPPIQNPKSKIQNSEEPADAG